MSHSHGNDDNTPESSNSNDKKKDISDEEILKVSDQMSSDGMDNILAHLNASERNFKEGLEHIQAAKKLLLKMNCNQTMAQFNCQTVFLGLKPNQDYWPQIRDFLEQEGVWPDQENINPNPVYTNQEVEQDLVDLGHRFEVVHVQTVGMQLNPQWLVLWGGLQQFVGEEVNAQNSGTAMLIRDVYLSPFGQQILDFITNHMNSILNLAVRLAPTLAVQPLAPNHIDRIQQQTQRRVFSLITVLVRLSHLIDRLEQISENYHQFLGIGQDIGPKLQPPHQG